MAPGSCVSEPDKRPGTLAPPQVTHDCRTMSAVALEKEKLFFAEPGITGTLLIAALHL